MKDQQNIQKSTIFDNALFIAQNIAGSSPSSQTKEQNFNMSDRSINDCISNRSVHTGLLENNNLRSFVSGGAAGITTCLMFHPLDVVRTKLQVTTNLVEHNVGRIQCMGLQTSSLFPNVTKPSPSSTRSFATLSHTVQTGGVRALYSGLSAPLAMQFLFKATVLTVNENLKLSLTDFKKSRPNASNANGFSTQLSMADYFFCGAVSGSINALLFVTPAEYVRNQVIVKQTLMKSILKSTINSRGILGFWRGAGVTLMRDSIGYGSFFMAFEMGKKHLPSITGVHREDFRITIGSGILAGISLWAVSLPLDSLKTLVQSEKATSAIKAGTDFIKRDGFLATTKNLYRGWPMALFGRGGPHAAVSLATYSYLYNHVF